MPRLSTFPEMWMRSVCAATHDMSVHVSRNDGWYGWSWNVTRSRPSCSESWASRTGPCGSLLVGVMNVPKSSSCP